MRREKIENRSFRDSHNTLLQFVYYYAHYISTTAYNIKSRGRMWEKLQEEGSKKYKQLLEYYCIRRAIYFSNFY